MKIFLPLCAAIAVVIAACNNVGTCPSSITPGGSCSGDNLSCPYTITSQSSSSTCQSFNDGGPVATSCTCTNGAWVCPSCGDDGGAGGDATVEGGGDAEADAGGDGSVEAEPEASVEASSAETSTDAASETAASVDSGTATDGGADAADGHD